MIIKGANYERCYILRDELTQERLRKLLRYDRRTGKFVWRITWRLAKKGVVAGYTAKSGYVRIGLSGTAFLGHRLAWLYVHGRFPTKLDHRDGDRSNNAIKNLREATTQQNGANRKRSRNNTSGYVGVHRIGNGWGARVCHKGRRYVLGSAKTAEEAAKMYDSEARRLSGKFARLNFPRRGEQAA